MANAHLTAVLTQGGKRITCNFDFVVSETLGPLNAARLALMAQTMYGSWDTGGGTPKTKYAPQTLLDHVEAYKYNVVAHTPTPTNPCLFQRQITLGPFGSAGPPVPGTYAVTGNAPPNVALVLSFKTALFSRRGRGRIYTPAPPEGVIDSAGEVDPTWLAPVRTGWINMIEAVEAFELGTDCDHNVWSCMSGDFNEVTDYVMRDRVDTQRRRLIRAIDTA